MIRIQMMIKYVCFDYFDVTGGNFKLDINDMSCD